MTNLTPKQQASYDKAWAKYIVAYKAAKAAWAFWKSPAAGSLETLAGLEAREACKAADAAENRARAAFRRVCTKLGL